VSQQELLSRVIAALDAAGIRFMVSGSLVSSLQGEPRATHDIDLVVDLPVDAVLVLAATLADPDLYLDAKAAAEAVRCGGMFNLIDTASGDKVDFWPLTGEPFDRSRFGRRIVVESLGIRMPVSTPEDTILMKLKWAAASGGSEKQTTDALRVYEVQRDALDKQYLAEWAAQLGLTAALHELVERAEPI
jgi:hypothetical protein